MTGASGCNTFESLERDEVLVVRIPEAVKTAVKEAAVDDHGRSMSGMVVRILREWLTEHDYLPRATDSKRKTKG